MFATPKCLQRSSAVMFAIYHIPCISILICNRVYSRKRNGCRRHSPAEQDDNLIIFARGACTGASAAAQSRYRYPDFTNADLTKRIVGSTRYVAPHAISHAEPASPLKVLQATAGSGPRN